MCEVRKNGNQHFENRKAARPTIDTIFHSVQQSHTAANLEAVLGAF